MGARFEVGDRVEVVASEPHRLPKSNFWVGRGGSVTEIEELGVGPAIMVMVDGGYLARFFASELTVVRREAVALPDGSELWMADPGCEHDVQGQWSGVKCVKCGGWFCY